jgi:hypothetical protein
MFTYTLLENWYLSKLVTFLGFLKCNFDAVKEVSEDLIELENKIRETRPTKRRSSTAQTWMTQRESWPTKRRSTIGRTKMTPPMKNLRVQPVTL